MPDDFIPLAALLREAPHRADTSAPSPVARDGEPAQHASEPGACDAGLIEQLSRELALVRLASIEAFERMRDRLAAQLAADVLARELELRPCDLARIAQRLVADLKEEEPVCVVVCSGDARCVVPGFPVRVDDGLRPGDLIVEVRDGEIDARFDLRVAAVVDDVISADGREP